MDFLLLLEPFKYAVFLSPIVFWGLYRKITHPVCIFVGVLSLQYLAYQLFQSSKYSALTENTESSIFWGLWAFVIGFSFVALLILLSQPKLKVKLVRNFSLPICEKIDRWYRFSILLMIFVVVGHLYVGYKNGLDGTYSSFFINVRMQYLLQPDSFSILPHMAILLQSWFVYLIIHRYNTKQVTLFFVLLSVICALSKVERSAILTCLLALLILRDHESCRGVSFRNIFFALTFVLGFFFFVAWQFDQNRTFSDVLFVFLDYFAKNLDTFNKYVSPLAATYDWGLVLGKYAALLGLSGPDAVVEIDVDGSFNTYSYLKNLYLFGGLSFVFFFNLFLGALFAFLYGIRYKLDGAVLGFISFFSFSLLVSFFAYAFAWTNWAYYIISFALVRFFTRDFFK